MRFLSRPARGAAAVLAVTGALVFGAAVPGASAATSGSTADADPSLATMNAAQDHTMGSTLDSGDSASTSKSTLTAKSFSALAANPPAAPTGLLGMDVSAWQHDVDFSAAYANGARFAYVKATEGTSYISARFAEQYTGSYAAGMAHGAYHFARPNISTGAAQAAYFVANGGTWTADGRTLPPLLDIEYNPYGATCYGLSATAMVTWITDFSSTMKSLTGITPAIYTTAGWWSACTGNSAAFSANPLFIARYDTESTGPGTLPASWTTYAIWQFDNEDKTVWPGDQDVLNGDAAALTRLALGGTAAVSSPAVVQSPVTLGTPQLSKTSVKYGAKSADAATIGVDVVGATSGSVVFRDGSTTIATAKISGGRAQTRIPATLAAKTYDGITASFAGDATHAKASSATAPALTVKTTRLAKKARIIGSTSFSAGTHPTVHVKLSKLTNERWPSGKVVLSVNGKRGKTVMLSSARSITHKGALNVKLGGKYRHSIRVKATYVGSPAGSIVTVSRSTTASTVFSAR